MPERNKLIRRFARAVWLATVIALGLSELASAQDGAKSAAGAFRSISSDRLTLVTDLPSNDAFDSLPGLFDQALDQWFAYFGMRPQDHAEWRLTGYLIADKARWQASGKLPADLPEFKSGWSRGRELWLYNQTSEYYRRHLLLHEGVHCLMNDLLGYQGPAWYAEGMAEMLATHRLNASEIETNYFPQSTEEVPRLGRIEIVQTALRERRGLSLAKVFAYDNRAHQQNEPYAWCWAAAAMLERHPRYRDRFALLKSELSGGDFQARVRGAYADDWGTLLEDWQIYVTSLEYGYDFERMTVDYALGKPLVGASEFEVAADRGWQNTGLLLNGGQTYELSASGQFQVGDRPKPWISEAGGVTIRYYKGRPLGMLLAAVRPEKPAEGATSPLVKPIAIGAAGSITPIASGTLYLWINDSAGELADNAGAAQVTVRAAAKKR